MSTKYIIAISICTLILICCESEKTKLKEDTEAFGVTNEHILSQVKNGVHVPTGLIAGQGLESVLTYCVSCHSAKLITQNRATKEGWLSMIHWMYETQNLPKLGEHEPIIVNYLADFYAPEALGRRKKLEIEEWYELN